MNGPRVGDEVHTRPRITGEEFGRQHVSFETIAAGAGEDDVAGDVGAPVRQRMDMVERGVIEFEWSSAVDASPAAISHRGSLDCSLVMS